MLHGRILLVDDNKVNQMVAGAMLERWKIRYECADDGVEAVKKFKQLKPDLILMDVQMPVCDGFAATKQIRLCESDGQRVPIIALTAEYEKLIRNKCLQSGMDDFISKPFNLEQLHAVLMKWLNPSKSEPKILSQGT